jgi:phage gp29-like protein
MMAKKARTRKPDTDETMAKLAAQAALEPTKDGEEQSTGDVAGAFTTGKVPIDWYFDDQDPEAFRRNYPEMMNDAAVKAAMLALLFEVCALDLNVHPADEQDEEGKEVAEFVKYALCATQGGLAALLMKMAKPALVNQFSISELVYQTETRGKWADKWVLKAVKSKDITNGNWSFRLDAFKNVLGIIHLQEGQTKVFDPGKFVRYALMPDYENPRAVSHLRAAYRAWWVKRTVMRAWAVFAERQGLVPFGTYQSESQKKALETQLAKFNSRRWLAVPEGVKLDVIRYVSGESGKSQQDIIRDLDKQIFLAIRLAFLQALEGDRTGARSMGEVHETTADLMAWFLAADLASTISTQIVPRLVELNYGEDTPCPVVKLESPVMEDLVQRSTVDTNLTAMGLELSKKQLREVYGRVEPEDEDDALKKAAPPPSPFGKQPGDGKDGQPPEPGDTGPADPSADAGGDKKAPEDLAKLAADDQAWLARSYRRLVAVLDSTK